MTTRQGEVLDRLGAMQSPGQRPASLGVVAIFALLVLPFHGNGELSCQPNIFGGGGLPLTIEAGACAATDPLPTRSGGRYLLRAYPTFSHQEVTGDA